VQLGVREKGRRSGTWRCCADTLSAGRAKPRHVRTGGGETALSMSGWLQTVHNTVEQLTHSLMLHLYH
jgi:hypothetical protein